MGRRGLGHRFMPNRLVFPGGAVDPEDYEAAAVGELGAHVRARLERSVSPSLARALAIAAARELREETGLSLGTPPKLEAIDYLCRAVTPEGSTIRFDAYFLVVDAACVRGLPADSRELQGVRYFGVDEALVGELAAPTRGVLHKLIAWAAMTEPERRSQTVVHTLLEQQWVLQ